MEIMRHDIGSVILHDSKVWLAIDCQHRLTLIELLVYIVTAAWRKAPPKAVREKQGLWKLSTASVRVSNEECCHHVNRVNEDKHDIL